MQETKYSVGPKFFGTTAKSILCIKKNRGSMKEIAVLLDRGHMILNASTKQILLIGH
jgi:hypothetical protein